MEKEIETKARSYVEGLLAPSVALGAVLSTACAAVFHLWQKGDILALRNYLAAAWLGFAGGHLLGTIAGVHWLQIGELNILWGTAGTLIALFIAKSLEA